MQLTPLPTLTPRVAEVRFRRDGRGPYSAPITGPDAIARLVCGLAAKLDGEHREHFFVVLLDSRYRTLGVYTASVGTVNQSLVSPREVFLPAVAAAAAAIVVAHNHPSGDATPSPEDRAVTTRLRAAGELLGIQVLDHVVIGDGRFFSFASETVGSF